MPSRRGCSSNLRFLIELYSALLLILVFAAITMLWCLAARNYSETGLTNGTNVSNGMTKYYFDDVSDSGLILTCLTVCASITIYYDFDIEDNIGLMLWLLRL